MPCRILVEQAGEEGKNDMNEQGEAEGVSTQGSQPRAVRVLVALVGVNGLFGVIWPVCVPTLPRGASQPWSVRPVALVLVIWLLSLIALVIASGLWRRQQWAFRAGMIITVFTIAIDLFVILVSIAQMILDVGALFALVLNGVVLSLFLQSEVIRAVIEW
jgi:hypothetical protein